MADLALLPNTPSLFQPSHYSTYHSRRLTRHYALYLF